MAGAALGLLLLAPGRLAAQSNLTITAQLTLRLQANSRTNNGVTIDRTTTARLTTKDLLTILGAHVGKDFSGATLALASWDSTNVYVLKKGVLLEDVTPYFAFTAYGAVFDSTFNSRTGKQTYQAYWNQAWNFYVSDDNYFYFSGLVNETFTASSLNRFKLQTLAESMRLPGTGDGQLGGSFAIVTGTITTSGKGVSPAAD